MMKILRNEDPDDSSCNFNDFFNGTDRNRNNDNSECVTTTLDCDGENCTANIKGLRRQCNFFDYNEDIVEATAAPIIECCSCNSSNGTFKWRDCNSLPSPPSSGEY